MDNYIWALITCLSLSEAFEEKGLATHGANVGLVCGHSCAYCSSKTINRRHPAFKQLGLNPFGQGYAIVSPDAPERMADQAQKIKTPAIVQLCTLTDAYSPEAQEHQLGRRSLKALLANPLIQVRVLTKNAAVAKDFDLIERHRDRVLVGLSITGTADKSDAIKVIEPSASSIQERMTAMREAHTRGLRTFGMLCPLLPGIANAPEQIDELVKFSVACGCEGIFAEPVNPRGSGLRLCQEALEQHGFHAEAQAIGKIRQHEHWSAYVVQLIADLQRSVRQFSDIRKLRFLLYPSGLLPEHVAQIKQDDAGVVWLGKDGERGTQERETLRQPAQP